MNADQNARIEVDSLIDIISRAQAGGRDAFDELLLHFEEKILKTAFYLVRNLYDAQDVAQEVYVKIFRNIHHCQDPDRIENWIYRITVNAARDHLRKRSFFLPLSNIVRGIHSRDPVYREEIRNALSEALKILSFNEKAVLIFKVLEEKSTAEISEILGCRDVTVRTHLHSARKKLQKHLKDFGRELWTD